MVIGLARPQFGHGRTDVQASGIDIMLALDVSGSMQALDFKLNGQPANRIETFLRSEMTAQGVPRDGDGRPDFRYVATHICDFVKRRLKAGGVKRVQGEFGIGLLSFWTLGDELTMTSTGTDQRAYQMVMRKGDPSYAVTPKRTLFGHGGTEVRIAPLLDGIRALSGEKIQWYLAAELRDRIRQTGVRINVVDRLARKQYTVEPRQYEGQLLHQLPAVHTPLGDIYVETL